MSIGYACKTIGVTDTDFKSCLYKNAAEPNLVRLIAYNLNTLANIIDYNIANDIMLHRITSDLIPFGSSLVNTLPWWDMFSSQFENIGYKIRNSGMRVSMHPGQYTVLNSPNVQVVAGAINDLNYHARVLEGLGLSVEHKIVLHIGGIYNNKLQAVRWFISHYDQLDDAVKQRLVIENDDKSYNIGDVLDLGMKLNIPVVFDNLHHQINPSQKYMNNIYWIDECKKTWQEKDGKQKIHYAQQDPSKRSGSHSNTIHINEFMQFYNQLDKRELDIMLEVKDKNLSAVKCINCTSPQKKITVLEAEWSKYKYSVLERSPADYLEVRRLLRSKSDHPVLAFYSLLESALQRPIDIGNSTNAALHVWGYFKAIATDAEKKSFLKKIQQYQQGLITIKSLKSSLGKLAVKHQQSYLLNSYYFDL